ncbi:MAG: hypothetical protein P1V20_16650, partial [Verrucomicrobiales bacterium]|nr:hypothetical protein [Verrucomicrobiales bacterium]
MTDGFRVPGQPDGMGCFEKSRDTVTLIPNHGACFSPDGSHLFVNIQSPGITLAISGPFV